MQIWPLWPPSLNILPFLKSLYLTEMKRFILGYATMMMATMMAITLEIRVAMNIDDGNDDGD